MTARSLDSAPMATSPRIRLLAAGFAALLALALSACGSSGPENGLTQEQSDKLVAALENLQQDQADGDCDGAADKLESIREDIAALEGVDGEIIKGLEELTDQTDNLLSDCTPKEEQTTSTTSTTPTTTTTTESSTTSEETDETTTEKPEEEEEPEQTPPEQEPPGNAPTEPPGNAPTEPPGNPDGGGTFDPGAGGVAPERGSDPPHGKGSGKDKAKGKKMKGPKSKRADEERDSR